MRKCYLFLTALLALFAVNANAERVLYQEAYEAGGVPSTWTAAGGTLSIASTEGSSILQFALGNSNGRSANGFWGSAIYEGITETEYSLSFEIRFDALGTNQYNGEVAIFSDPDKCMMTNGSLEGKGKDYDPYANRTNCLFSLVQTNSADAKQNWKINNDESKIFTPNVGAEGTWYSITLTVNTQSREVAYEIFDYDQSKAVATGVKTMADDAQMYATGLYLMAARYWSIYSIDNLKVYLDIDFANKPVVALTGLNMAERTYTISFLEGETLHVIGTDGQETTVDFYDVENGEYKYTTTTSGTLTAWTTAGTMTSEKVVTEVVCEPITIPEPAQAIVAAEAGYGKTYQFTIDNANIALQPAVFMDFSFKSADGSADFVLNDQNNGVKVALPTRGELTIVTKALGYQSGTYKMMNDQEFEVKHDIDIQHMTVDELTEKGFQAMDDLNSTKTSGEDNWTARQRLYLSIKTGEKDEEGNELTTKYLVYGPTQDAEGNPLDNGAEAIKRMQFMQSKLDESYKTLFAPAYIWHGIDGIKSPSNYFEIEYEEDGTTVKSATPKADDKGNVGGSCNPKMYLGIGLCQSGVLGDAATYDPANAGYGNILLNDAPIGVDGLTDEDFIVVSKIGDYGSTSVHPVFEAGTSVDDAKAQYKAMNLGDLTSVIKGDQTFTIHRVDEVLTRILVLTPKNGTGIETINYNKVVTDHNAPIYNLNGVQMNPNALTKGIYIKQGKKFIVR